MGSESGTNSLAFPSPIFVEVVEAMSPPTLYLRCDLVGLVLFSIHSSHSLYSLYTSEESSQVGQVGSSEVGMSGR